MSARFRAEVADGLDAWSPTWNAAPTQRHPVVLQGPDGGRRIGPMAWGWTPSFMAGRTLVNARGEEAHGKPTFATAMKRRRCIVPATAFYEWIEAGHIPHAFALADRSLFGIAGLWESAPVADGGVKPVGRYLLLTVPANDVVAPVHHRMAAILAPEDESTWLATSSPDEAVRACLRPYDPGLMKGWAVGKAVNAVRNDGAGLVVPVG